MVYLKDIALQNFKCFRELPPTAFGKITLLTGANSTGKSSLMYGILGVLQSNNYPFMFSANGQYIEMGNFLEMVHKHARDKKISITLTFVDTNWDISYSIKTEWINDDVGNPRFLSCEGSSVYSHFLLERKPDGLLYLTFDYEPAKNPGSVQIKELLSSINQEDAERLKYEKIIDILKYSNEEVHVSNVPMLAKNDDWEVLDDRVKYSYLFVLQEIRDLLSRYNKNVNYISSFRQPAQRIYAEKAVFKGKIASNGEGFINELLTWKDSDKEKFSLFVESMRSIGLLADVEPTRMGDGQFKVNIRVHEKDEMANLSDVGFGISQLMPIIIGDVELGNGSTLYISQPEVHLHPKAQANIGDYLVRGIKRDKRYVVETHSEYLLNRLRLAIVKGQLSEDDIKVYYMFQENDETKLATISFNKSGQIIGAPQDFFDTYMMDVMDIAMNAE